MTTACTPLDAIATSTHVNTAAHNYTNHQSYIQHVFYANVGNGRGNPDEAARMADKDMPDPLPDSGYWY